MTDDLGYEDGELSPFMTCIGLSLMGLNVVATLIALVYGS